MALFVFLSVVGAQIARRHHEAFQINAATSSYRDTSSTKSPRLLHVPLLSYSDVPLRWRALLACSTDRHPNIIEKF